MPGLASTAGNLANAQADALRASESDTASHKADKPEISTGRQSQSPLCESIGLKS